MPSFELQLNFEPARRSKFKIWKNIFRAAVEFQSRSKIEIKIKIRILSWSWISKQPKDRTLEFEKAGFQAGVEFWASSKILIQYSKLARSSTFEIFDWLEIQLQLEFWLLKILNFDLRAGSKINSMSKFWCWNFWISISELARNTVPARNSGVKKFEFRYSRWLEILLQLEIRLLQSWISFFELTQN
jgi:hypothetical protein